MARRAEVRTFNISVIGLSGTERDKGQYGVGKSCLCNRFLTPVADNYYSEHISVLSQSDFAGRVINNDHFLYWGSVTKTDDGNNYTFHVVEQTEFIDDVSFSPFKPARTETYSKRAVGTKVQSAEKLMYICKDQLGMETDSAYPQVMMPEGKLTIDGFLCCYDVSQVPQRPPEKQAEFVTGLLLNALKTKKPVVLATTKCDASRSDLVKEALSVVNRKELKGNVPLVETCAHENINVEACFMLLAHLIDKTKGRSKILPMLEARKQRYELLEVAKEAYLNLLRTSVAEPKATWASWKKRLEKESDFIHYVDMLGTDQARKEFRAHTKRLHDELVKSREQSYLNRLPILLKRYLPSLDSITERGWNTIRRLIRDHPDFERDFVIVEEGRDSSWKNSDEFLDRTEENRIPFDLLSSAEAEMCFRNHLNELQALHRKRELQRQFKKLLEENTQVSPGKPLNETYLFFAGKECFSSLDGEERNFVYEQHMKELRNRARAQFQELLWEKAHIFLELLHRVDIITSDDLKTIMTALEDDSRYKALNRLEEDRKVLILNHLGFMQAPSRERCWFVDHCIDTQVENLLGSRAIRPELKGSTDSIDSGNKTLNLVLLGRDGLAITLNKEIRNLCVDDEYHIDNTVYSLDYRPIDGDVSREQNALATANFKPHGCLCVYNSNETLEYIKDSLDRSLTNDVVREEETTLRGMPVVIIQAFNSSHSSEDREILEKKGNQVAQRFHGEFIPEFFDDEGNNEFVKEQIHSALQSVIRGCSPGLNSWYLSAQFEPDIRLSMCLMCGDPFPIELPLGPLLNHEMCRVLADTPYCITLDLELEVTKQQKVEIEVASYHGGENIHQGLFHGYILVYSTKRKGSLANLRAFSAGLLDVPKLVLGVVDSSTLSTSSSASDLCQAMIQEGNQTANCLNADFMTTTANFTQQTSVFLPFFKHVWDLREESEGLYNEPSDEPCPPPIYDKSYYITKPPAPLPKQSAYMFHTHKSSTSNSTDSEPVYDTPNLFHSHYSDSDHEAERGSSVSPPPTHTEEIYSKVLPHNGEHLVKPSVVKARRHVKAALGDSNSNCQDLFSREQLGSNNSSHDLIWTNDYYHSAIARKKFMNSRSKSSTAALTRSRTSEVTAPLAMPEPIEIADYCPVKDAVPPQHFGDNDYQMVADALPPGQLTRIRSTKSPLRTKDHTDSDDSEVSSLEREGQSLSKKSAPNRRSKKQRESIYDRPTYSDRGRQSMATSRDNRTGLVHAASEDGSEGTGEEMLENKRERKRRSFSNRKWRVPSANQQSIFTQRTSSPVLADFNHLRLTALRYDDVTHYDSVVDSRFQTLPKNIGTSIGTSEETEFDLNDSGNWGSRFRGFKTLRDPEKQKKKDERRRQKEEEKKAKEAQRKIKKKDSKSSAASTSGSTLDECPVALENPSVPLFVYKCVNYIETEGLKTEGVYRISGSKAQGELLNNKFSEDPNVDISALEIPVNAVATLLKSFFNDLQEALIPYSLYDELMFASEMNDKSGRLLMLRGVIKKLPNQNLEVLKFLISHLYNVSLNSEYNNMNSRNLAKCWWPTLMRLQFMSYEKLIQSSQIPEDIIHSLIEQCPFFFFGGSEKRSEDEK